MDGTSRVSSLPFRNISNVNELCFARADLFDKGLILDWNQTGCRSVFKVIINEDDPNVITTEYAGGNAGTETG